MSSEPVIRIAGLSGSIRSGSYNTALIELARTLAPDGVEVQLVDGLQNVEPFSEDDEASPPAGVTAFRQQIRSADAVLIATPEYNSSIPGQLKNALDWASRSDYDVAGKAGSALYGVPVAAISASKGQYGGVWAAEHLQKVLAAQGARVINSTTVALPKAQEAFDEHGRIAGNGIEDRLVQLLVELRDQTRELHRQLARATAITG